MTASIISSKQIFSIILNITDLDKIFNELLTEYHIVVVN